MRTGPGAEPTWPDLFATLVTRADLTATQAGWAMDRFMSGEASVAQTAAFLIALRAKGETVEELTGMADRMLAHAHRFTLPMRTVDVVGTGGDRAHTVNVSTMASIVVAGAGLTVVKHGNRAATSKSGSADVLEALGLDLTHPPERVADLAREAGITFCFAQVFHPSMRHVGAARKELGVPTTFNFLGPLTNPAQPQSAAVGVADSRMAGLIAGVLATRGKSALVFRGEDGLDELAPTAPSRVWEVRDGHVTEHVVDWVAELGLAPVTVADLRGGDAQTNASVVTEVLAGRGGAARETVLLNAAAGLVADGTLPGTSGGALVTRIRAGLDLASQAVDSGAAAEALKRWRTAAQRG